MDSIATLLIRAKNLKKYNNTEAASAQVLKILNHSDLPLVCSLIEDHYQEELARSTSYVEEIDAGPDIELDSEDVQDLHDDVELVEDDVFGDNFDYNSSEDIDIDLDEDFDPSTDIDQGIEIELDDAIVPEELNQKNSVEKVKEIIELHLLASKASNKNFSKKRILKKQERSSNIKELNKQLAAIDVYSGDIIEDKERVLDLTKEKERKAIKAPLSSAKHSSKIKVTVESIKAKKASLLA